MLTVQEDVIRMTKGDTASFEITIFTPEEKVYNLKHNDKVVFYLSKTPCMSQGNIYGSLQHSPYNEKKRFLLVKEFENKLIKLDSEDTMYLNTGLYYWKCELVYANEEVNSICGGKFYLTCDA